MANIFDGMPTTTYQLGNHLGSVSIRLSDSGTILDREEYYPFGDSSVRTWSKKRYRYVGKEKDQESGLYYYGARYYSAWTCKFISTDPLARDYPQLTSYNYAGNKPINHLDIDGMQSNGEPTGDDQNTDENTGNQTTQKSIEDLKKHPLWGKASEIVFGTKLAQELINKFSHGELQKVDLVFEVTEMPDTHAGEALIQINTSDDPENPKWEDLKLYQGELSTENLDPSKLRVLVNLHPTMFFNPEKEELFGKLDTLSHEFGLHVSMHADLLTEYITNGSSMDSLRNEHQLIMGKDAQHLQVYLGHKFYDQMNREITDSLKGMENDHWSFAEKRAELIEVSGERKLEALVISNDLVTKGYLDYTTVIEGMLNKKNKLSVRQAFIQGKISEKQEYSPFNKTMFSLLSVAGRTYHKELGNPKPRQWLTIKK